MKGILPSQPSGRHHHHDAAEASAAAAAALVAPQRGDSGLPVLPPPSAAGTGHHHHGHHTGSKPGHARGRHPAHRRTQLLAPLDPALRVPHTPSANRRLSMQIAVDNMQSNLNSMRASVNSARGMAVAAVLGLPPSAFTGSSSDISSMLPTPTPGASIGGVMGGNGYPLYNNGIGSPMTTPRNRLPALLVPNNGGMDGHHASTLLAPASTSSPRDPQPATTTASLRAAQHRKRLSIQANQGGAFARELKAAESMAIENDDSMKLRIEMELKAKTQEYEQALSTLAPPRRTSTKKDALATATTTTTTTVTTNTTGEIDPVLAAATSVAVAAAAAAAVTAGPGGSVGGRGSIDTGAQSSRRDAMISYSRKDSAFVKR
jgi:hypothetical protein